MDREALLDQMGQLNPEWAEEMRRLWDIIDEI